MPQKRRSVLAVRMRISRRCAGAAYVRPLQGCRLHGPVPQTRLGLDCWTRGPCIKLLGRAKLWRGVNMTPCVQCTAAEPRG